MIADGPPRCGRLLQAAPPGGIALRASYSLRSTASLRRVDPRRFAPTSAQVRGTSGQVRTDSAPKLSGIRSAVAQRGRQGSANHAAGLVMWLETRSARIRRLALPCRTRFVRSPFGAGLGACARKRPRPDCSCRWCTGCRHRRAQDPSSRAPLLLILHRPLDRLSHLHRTGTRRNPSRRHCTLACPYTPLVLRTTAWRQERTPGRFRSCLRSWCTPMGGPRAVPVPSR
jgi:hypothetical protein